MRKAGAYKVQCRALHDGNVDIDVEWPLSGPCEREHVGPEDISEEEWDRRHAWSESLGEYNLRDGMDMFEELGNLRRQRDHYRDELQALRDIQRHSVDRPIPFQDDDFPSSEESAGPRLDAPVVEPPDSPPEEEKFDQWFAKDPNPPHFNR